MRLFSFRAVLGVVAILLLCLGCEPMRGTMPRQTWRFDDPNASCSFASLSDPQGTGWSRRSRRALTSALAEARPLIVQALGCRVEALPHCSLRETASPGSVRLEDLEGSCQGATHVVRIDTVPADEHLRLPRTVELTPLSLGERVLTGSWSGTMRQPGAPYEQYNISLELTQEHDRVVGTTELWTLDDMYWGELRFEGRLEGTTLFFADVELIDDNLGPFLEWCMKGGYLVVDLENAELTGLWRAPMCAPGSLELHRPGETWRSDSGTTSWK